MFIKCKVQWLSSHYLWFLKLPRSTASKRSLTPPIRWRTGRSSWWCVPLEFVASIVYLHRGWYVSDAFAICLKCAATRKYIVAVHAHTPRVSYFYVLRVSGFAGNFVKCTGKFGSVCHLHCCIQTLLISTVHAVIYHSSRTIREIDGLGNWAKATVWQVW